MANPATVTNRVDVASQVGAGIVVGMTAAITAVSSGVRASGGAASTVGPGAR